MQNDILTDNKIDGYNHKSINDIHHDENEIRNLKNRLGIGQFRNGTETIVGTAYLNEFAKAKGINLFSFTEKENETLRFFVKNFTDDITGLNRNNSSIKDKLFRYFSTYAYESPKYYATQYKCLSPEYSHDNEHAETTISNLWKDLCDSVHGKNNNNALSDAYSKNTSYYTPKEITSILADIVKSAGLQDGQKLGDFAVGMGAFVKDYEDKRLNITGIDIDILASLTTKILYPYVNTINSALQDVRDLKKDFDITATNVPFSGNSLNVVDLTWDYKSSAQKMAKNSLHNYYIMKMLEQTKEGGMSVIITSTGFLDNSRNEVRKEIANQAKLIGVVRLPSGIFVDSEQTECDLLIFRKWKKGEDKIQKFDFIESNAVTIIEKNSDKKGDSIKSYNTRYVNNLFIESYKTLVNNKEEVVNKNSLILGNLSIGTRALGKFVKKDFFVKPIKSIDIDNQNPSNILSSKDLKDLSVKIKSTILDQIKEEGEFLSIIPEQQIVDEVKNIPTTFNRNAIIIEENGIKVPYVEYFTYSTYGEQSSVIEKIEGLSDKQISILSDYIELRNAYKTHRKIAKDNAGIKDSEDFDKSLAHIKNIYENFIQKNGNLFDNKEIQFIKDYDKDFLDIILLEKKNEEGEIIVASILERNIFVNSKQKLPTSIEEHVLYSMNKKFGEIDIAYLEENFGANWQEICKGEIFFCPEEEKFIPKNIYLSGNIADKINYIEASGLAEKYAENISALKEAMPKRLTIDEIDIQGGLPYISKEIYSSFCDAINEGIGTNSYTFQFNETLCTIECVSRGKNENKYFNQIASKLGLSLSEGMPFDSEDSVSSKLKRLNNALDCFIQGGVATFGTRQKKDESYEVYAKRKGIWEFEAKNLFIELNKLLKRFIKNTPEHSAIVEKKYNDSLNSYVVPKFDGSFIQVDGLRKDLYDYQRRAIAQMLYNRTGLLDHAVGAGKTLTMASLMKTMKKMNMCNRPVMIVRPNNIASIKKDLESSFENTKIVYVMAGDGKNNSIANSLKSIKNEDFDLCVMTESALAHIYVPNAELIDIKRDIVYQNELMDAILSDNQKSTKYETVLNEIRKRISKLHENLKLLEIQEEKDKKTKIGISDLGFDFFCVDEAHGYKNLATETGKQMTQGSGVAESSNKAKNMMSLCHYIHTLNNNTDTGIVMATGTPITNAITEMLVYFKYIKPNFLKKAGWDDKNFENTFYPPTEEITYDAIGTPRRQKVYGKISNINALSPMYMTLANVVDTENTPLLLKNRPKGNVEQIMIPSSSAYYAVTEDIKLILEYQKAISSHKEPARSLNELKYIKLTEGERKALSLTAISIARRGTVDVDFVIPQEVLKTIATDYNIPVSLLTRNSKRETCVKMIKDRYDETVGVFNGKEYKGVQLIFCDQVSNARYEKKEIVFTSLLENHNKFITLDEDLKIMTASLKKKTNGGESGEDDYEYLKNDELNNHIDNMIDHIRNNYDLEDEILGKEAKDIIVQLERAKDETKTHHKWSFYEVLKNDLIKAGIPANEIVFFNNSTYGADNKKKEQLISDINSAKYRVVIGSSESMGVGNNLQESIVGGIMLDAPWKASDDEQRLGRMMRQGNKIPKELLDKWGGIKAYRFTQENSNDVFMYDKIIRKGNMIRSIKNGTTIERNADFVSKGLATDANGELSVSAEECMANLNSNFNLEIKQSLKDKITQLETEQTRSRNQVDDREKKLAKTQKAYEKNTAILNDLQANATYLKENCAFYNSKIADAIYAERLAKVKDKDNQDLFENSLVKKDSVYLNIDGVEYSNIKSIAKAIRSFEHSNRKAKISAFGIDGTIEGKGSENKIFIKINNLKDIVISNRMVKEGEQMSIEFNKEQVNILEKEIDFSLSDDKLAHLFGDLIKYQLSQESRYHTSNEKLKEELNTIQSQKVQIFDKGDILTTLSKKWDECESIENNGKKIYSRSQASEFKELVEDLISSDKENRGVLISAINDIKFKTISVAQTSSQFLSLENDILLSLIIGDEEKKKLLAPLDRDADIDKKEDAYNTLEAITSQCRKLSENKEELSLDHLNIALFEYSILDKYNHNCGKFYPYRYVSNSEGDYLMGVLISEGQSEQKIFDCKDVNTLHPNIEYAVNVANGTEIKFIEDELLTQGIISQNDYNRLKNGFNIFERRLLDNKKDNNAVEDIETIEITENDSNHISEDESSIVVEEIKNENNQMEPNKYEFPYADRVESKLPMWQSRFSKIGIPDGTYSLEEDMELSKKFMSTKQFEVCANNINSEIYVKMVRDIANGARKAFKNYFEGSGINEEGTFNIYGTRTISVLSWDGDDYINGLSEDWTGYSTAETYSLSELLSIEKEKIQEIDSSVVAIKKSLSLSETIIDQFEQGKINYTELIESRNMYRDGGEEIVSLVSEQMMIDESQKESVEEILDKLNSVISPAYELIWHHQNGELDDNTIIVISSCFNENEIDMLSEQLRDMKLIESKSNLSMSDEHALKSIIEQGKNLSESLIYKQILEDATVGKQFESIISNCLQDNEKRQILLFALDEYTSGKYINEDKSIDYEGSLNLIKETIKKTDSNIKLVDYDVLPSNIRRQRVDIDVQSLSIVNDIASEYHQIQMLRCDYNRINRSFEIAESKYQNPALAKNPVFQQIFAKAKVDKEKKTLEITETISNMKYFNQERLEEGIYEDMNKIITKINR